jgi:hypothetical protein
MNGGVAKVDLGAENIEALTRGAVNIQRHIENLRGYGLPVLVALNHFTSDTPAEVETVKRIVAGMGAQAYVCRHWAEGGKGAEELAKAVIATLKKAKTISTCSTTTPCPCSPRSRRQRQTHLSRRSRRGLAENHRAAEALGGCRLWPPARVHRQDAVLFLDRPHEIGRARMAMSSTCAKCASPPAQVSSWRSAAT